LPKKKKAWLNFAARVREFRQLAKGAGEERQEG